ncbi:hypothetical protein CASFOL_024828 [Castilleja foliolosa]|uniref:Centromere protein C n=1 Tax=Castilleja foliolosa TaxID=1961234 RepID=A0ABD3CQN9_9LAMI
MSTEATVSAVIDPLSGLIGPSLFPRTIKAPANVPVPPDPKDLDSVHNFMKSLDLMSPGKLNEAKRIVDGGAELLESTLASFAENVGIANAVAAKCKDRPQERRPGLGLARKRRHFSLKTSNSQPTVIVESSVDINSLEDPDEFFDAYERTEKANKEIKKQMGVSVDNVDLFKPLNKRHRRPSILGRTYKYKHRYNEDDYTLMSSQETLNQEIPSAPSGYSLEYLVPLKSSQETVDQGIPTASKDSSKENTVHQDPNPDADLEEVELAGSMKKTNNEDDDLLEELLSCNYEVLEGDGAMNLLQERLNIKPYDQESLPMAELPPEFRRTSISTVSESFRKLGRNSLVIDSVLKNLSIKPTTQHEGGTSSVSPLSSPTPPTSPFVSISVLKRRILQPNPLRDPFLPVDAELLEFPNVSASEPKDQPLGQVDAANDFCMPSELESHVDVGDTEASEPKDQPLQQVDAANDLGMPSELELHVDIGDTEPVPSNMDAHEAMGNEYVLPEQLVDENASAQHIHADSRPIEEPDNDLGRTMNVNDNEPNPSVLEEETRDDTPISQETVSEQQPEVHKAKRPRRNGAAAGKQIIKAHPMRKSLAEAGTSFETGVRRSKRIRMRPLEFWKGERFLYGRVDDSKKLLGVKYLSPGKGNMTLKVKPFILSESAKFKEELELAARH